MRHRVEMWREIGNRTEALIRAHGPVYRRWVAPRLRRGEVVALVAESRGVVAGSGAMWWTEDHPRPGVPSTRVPYVHSMYTELLFRGRGLATKIVRGLVRKARAEGAVLVLLHASPKGRPVYERLRFQPTTEMRLWLRRPAGVRTMAGVFVPEVKDPAPGGSPP